MSFEFHPDDATLRRLYSTSTVLLYPSRYEGFGLPPLEAMACGCPVAASDRGALAEICGDAAAPLDPEDPDSIAAAIERVTGDEALRERLRAAGLKRAASFTWKAAADSHRAIYARAAKGPA